MSGLDVLCFQWESYWPHAVPDITAVRTTDDRGKVTCDACLWALGSQKHDPPAQIAPARVPSEEP